MALFGQVAVCWFITMMCLVNSEKIVMTNTGPVRSKTIAMPNNDVEAFLGIPFAEPPIGNMRFRKPVPVTPWKEVYNATKKPPPCCQNATQEFYYMPNTENMTENCLYLNLWVPNSNLTSKKPVMLFIHGGAFNIGSSEMDIYDGATIANYGDVIFGSLNYRIGILGFLVANIDDADGNMGLYDQVMALEWFKANVEAFGGDSEEITLIGESAGAISIGGHLVSPLTRKLFKRAILESGAPIHPISFESTKTQLKLSNTIAKMAGCADDEVGIATDPQLVVDCLKRVPPEDLTRAEGLLMKSNPLTVFPRWGDAYMPKETTEMVREFDYKSTEILMGVNQDEGSFFLTAVLPDYFGIYGNNGLHRLSKRLAHSLIMGMFKFTEQKNTREIADFYIGNIKNLTTENLRAAVYNSLGDYMITCNTLFFADFYSRRNEVYFYMFTHRPSMTLNADWVGATHYDEVQYVMGHPIRGEQNYTMDEEQLSRRIMDRWLSFVKSGNPNIPGQLKWPIYTHENPVYLQIDVEEMIRLRPEKNRCEFWRERFHSQFEDESAELLVVASANTVYHNYLWLTIVGLIAIVMLNEISGETKL